MKLGPMMECNVEAFLKAIEKRRNATPFRYLEVGCAFGGTMSGIAQCLNESLSGCWQAIGLDKREGGWEYSEETYAGLLGPLYGGKIAPGIRLDSVPFGKAYLNDFGSHFFLPACKDTFDLVLIDACHGKDCCTKDFLMVEPLVNPEGFVFFHDADPDTQGKDLQPHCQQTIGVRQALKELGLLDSSRVGWQLIEDIQPEDHKDRGCVVVQRQMQVVTAA